MIYNDPMLRKQEASRPAIPVGPIWTIAESGDWEVPATGSYLVELHGGGGGAYVINTRGASGGGSGEIYIAEFAEGDIVPVQIGNGGATPGGDGEETTFGALSCPGGGGGKAEIITPTNIIFTAGSSSGSIATTGIVATTSATGTTKGGYGNRENIEQTYGNGGSFTGRTALAGQPGAAIITYLGEG